MNNVLLKGTKYFEHINKNIAKINIPKFRTRTVVFIVKMCLINYCYAKLYGITVFIRNLKYHPSIKCVVIGTQKLIVIIIFLHGLGRLTCSGIDALPSYPGASTISSSSGFVVEGVFGGLVLSVLSRWLIQICLYLVLTSCIPGISSSFLVISLHKN